MQPAETGGSHAGDAAPRHASRASPALAPRRARTSCRESRRALRRRPGHHRVSPARRKLSRRDHGGSRRERVVRRGARGSGRENRAVGRDLGVRAGQSPQFRPGHHGGSRRRALVHRADRSDRTGDDVGRGHGARDPRSPRRAHRDRDGIGRKPLVHGLLRPDRPGHARRGPDVFSPPGEQRPARDRRGPRRRALVRGRPTSAGSDGSLRRAPFPSSRFPTRTGAPSGSPRGPMATSGSRRSEAPASPG